MELTVRPVKPEDLDAAAAVEGVCFPPAEAASRDSLEKRIAQFPECFFVAEQDGELVGLINGMVTDSKVIRDEMFDDAGLHQPDGPYQMIFGLAVHPDHQRQGVAEQLMRRLIQESKEVGRKGMALTCKEHLIHYYAKFGYENLGVSRSTHGGAVWYDMFLDLTR